MDLGSTGTRDVDASAFAPPDWARDRDLVIGSDVVYQSDGVTPLVNLLLSLRKAVIVVVGPATRPSMPALASDLSAHFSTTGGGAVKDYKLTLLCGTGDAELRSKELLTYSSVAAGRVRSCGVHQVLVVRR